MMEIETYSVRTYDYNQYPDSIAPRRFELINPQKDNGVYGHGVAFANGQAITSSPFYGITVHPNIEAIEPYTIRYIDPPFPREEEE